MGHRRRTALLTALALDLALLACTSGSTDPPASTDDPAAGAVAAPFPPGVTAYVDQGRVDRVGRGVFVRLVNDRDDELTITRAEVTSDRFAPVVWTGEKGLINEVDLPLELPPGRCGTGSDADLRLTYRVGDGPLQVSETRATDRYGAIGLFLDRDCAAETLAEAADLVVGDHRVVGVGADSVFEVDVTLTGTGARDDVAFTGFDGTVLFALRTGVPHYPDAAPLPLVAGTSERLRLRVVPTRCDPHALAEDKVGTLFFVHVSAPEVPPDTAFYLPLDDTTRADLRAFFGTHCGLTQPS